MNRVVKIFLLLSICQQALAMQPTADNIDAVRVNEGITFDTEVTTPQIGNKQKAYIAAYMKQIAENLYRENFDVEMMRNGEVVIAIIPTDDLFPPNESTLLKSSSRTLDRFKQFIKGDNKFKIILAVHSDDTGSEEYLYDLTENRILSILDYYDRSGASTENIVGFPKGCSEPIKPNNSRTGRAANRRLEIFIVPGEQLIEEARLTKKRSR